MHVAVRSPLTAGIALAGAGAIALAPIAPPMPALPDIPARVVSSAEVALTAMANPIEQWAQVIQAAVANAGALGEQWLADPAPVLRQLLTNQLGYGQQVVTAAQTSLTNLLQQLSLTNPDGTPAQLKLVVDQIAAGQFYTAMETLFNTVLATIALPALPLLDLLQIPVTMAQNFANAVAVVPTQLIQVSFSALGVGAGAFAAFGTAGQAVVDALSAGDLLGAVTAVVSIPATVIGAVLNGFAPTFAPGLLTADGPLAGLLNAAVAIAQALTPSTPLSGLTQAKAATGPAEANAVPESVTQAAMTATVTVSTTTEATEAVTSADSGEAAAPGTEGEAETPTAPSETDTTDQESGTTDETTEANGATDLSDGNKAEPGSTGEATQPSDNAGSAETASDDDADTGSTSGSGGGPAADSGSSSSASNAGDGSSEGGE